jgi:acyl-CoA synthetase (NDP forming)
VFNPKTVAVIGASDNPEKLGYYCLSSLVHGGFRGKVYPINPKLKTIMGLPAYTSITAVPEEIDLAILVVPPAIVPQVLEECGSKNVKGAVVVTAGFKEKESEDGALLQENIKSIAERAGVKVIGPNTFGIVNLNLDLNASFTPELSKIVKGGVSLVGQSGGVCHLAAYLSTFQGLGYSKIVGLGNRCNVDFADVIEFFGEDIDTKIIAIHIEGIDEPRKLMQAAKCVSPRKPIVAYKTGKSSVADKASKTHTGSLAGNYQLYQAAFRQAGILAVRDIEDFLDALKALNMCPIPQGDDIAIITGQAGLGIIAADACYDYGLELAKLSGKTSLAVSRLLPPLSMRENPIDMGPSWNDLKILRSVIEEVVVDESVHALILCFAYTSASLSVVPELMLALKDWARIKPVVACLAAPRGGWPEEIERLESCGVATFPTPSRAVKAVSFLAMYRRLIRKSAST